jgi:glycosyltransferase involved in cell wall biosynthesis
MSKLVSVIIPTYNRADQIEEAARSVLDQTYSNLELLIVDDCSTDNTEEVVKSIDDDRVKYLKHKTNKGQGPARNTAIERAKGEYIAFLDSDDRWLPSKLEKQINVLEKAPENTKIAYCGRYNRLNSSNILKEADIDYKGEEIYEELLKGWMDALTSQLVFHNSCFEEKEGFDKTFPSFQEYELLVRMTEDFDATYIKDPLVEWDEGGEGISSSYEKRLEGLNRFIDKHEERLEKTPGTGPEMFYETRITNILGNKTVHKISNRKYREGLHAFREYYKSHDSRIRPFSLLILALLFSENTVNKISLTEKAVSEIR